jgi:hypothetical protein
MAVATNPISSSAVVVVEQSIHRWQGQINAPERRDQAELGTGS